MSTQSTKKQTAKHTPGPWTINPASPRDHHRDSVIVDDAGDRIALVRGQDVVDSIHLANARLVASAPCLLAACEAVLRECYVSESDEGGDVAEMSADVLDILRAAIAKARGGA